ncbi:MAG: siphovirus Gp157 family protein [Alistipes sp.]|nr:siphovirus Gp157 family protein [Alistipes sp.]
MGEKISLYELTSEHRLICDAIEEAGGEITPEIEAMLAINEENFLTKAEGYAEIIAKYTILAENAKTRKAQCERVQKIAENAVKRMKERIAQAMEEYNLPKVEVGMHKFSFRTSKAVDITDEAKIPNEYIKVATSVDKTKLRADLMAGVVIEGAELKEKKSLQVR